MFKLLRLASTVLMLAMVILFLIAVGDAGAEATTSSEAFQTTHCASDPARSHSSERQTMSPSEVIAIGDMDSHAGQEIMADDRGDPAEEPDERRRDDTHPEADAGDNNDDREEDGKLVIFSQCTNAVWYRAYQNRRFVELFDEHEDIRIEILDAQNQAHLQIQHIENAIRRRPDILIVAPLNRTALNQPMKLAMEAGIPVICLERGTSEPNYTTFIGVDNVAIGRIAGELILKGLKEKNGEIRGNLIELTGHPSVQGAIDRHAGAFEVLQPHIDSGAIEVVHTAAGNWIRDQAEARMQEAYNATEGNFDAVYAHNDSMAYGAYLVTKARNADLAEAAIFVGSNGLEEEGVRYVREGVLDATVEYPLCVDEAVEVAVNILTDPGFEPEPVYNVAPKAITPETLAELDADAEAKIEENIETEEGNSEE